MWIAIQNAVGARQGVGGGPTPPPYTPPLDAYTNTVVAYSVRKLSSSYSGPCMQVRRASDSTTLDIGFDTNGLVKTADIAAFCAGSVGTVSIWYDQGSLGQNATATTSNEPTIYSGTAFYYVNGIPTLRANGNNVRFDDVVSHTGDWCNLFIMSSNATSSPYITSYTIGPTSQGSVYGSNANSFMLSSGGNVTVPGDASGQNIHSIFSNASRLQYSRNAIGDVTAGGMTGRTYDSFLLRRATDSASVNMQEWIMWDSDLIAAQSTLETNLNEYYQVTNLPYYTSGLLADYSGATAAYSVRKLSNTAIKCMRVRRDAPPYDELDIGFTTGGDLDTAAIVAFGGSDVLTVSRWYDQSGNSRHAVQGTSSDQPEIYNGTAVITENGKSAINWNVTNTTSLATSNFTHTAGAVSIFTVVNRKLGTTGRGFLVDVCDNGIFGSSHGYRLDTFNNQYRFGTNQNITSAPYTPPTGQVLFGGIANSSGRTIYVDGTSEATTSGNQNTFFNSAEEIVLGNRTAGGPGVFEGVIQEVLIWENDQSANRTAIETNIMTYYGIP